MRCAALIFLLSVPAIAGEEALLHAFNVARADPFSPRGYSAMDRAIEGLAKSGGAKSVAALATFLREADIAERKVREERLAIQKRGRTAHTGMQQVTRELEHLRHRENAGATGLGPQITAREERLRSMELTLDDAKRKTLRTIRTQNEIGKKRQATVIACSKILARLKPEEIGGAIGSLRKSLDVDNHDQVLLLVRVLRESKRTEAAPALLDIYSHPKADVNGRVSAACAIAALAEPKTTKQLVERLRIDSKTVKPGDRTRILHALGMAAKRPIKDLDAAAAWAKGLQ